MFECLLWGTGQQGTAARARALGAVDLGMAYAPWEEVAINPTQSHQNLHRTGETDSWRHKQNFVCTRTQDKGAVTPQETDPDLPMSVQESLVEARACCRAGGTERSNPCLDLSKEVQLIMFINSTTVWPQVK